MRLYGVLAVADGRAQQVLGAIPGLSLVREAQHAHPHLRYQRAGETLDIIVMPLAGNVTLGQASNAPSGKWDLVVLVADSRDVPEAHHRWLARAWRYLLRWQAASPGWLLGPWSPAYVAETWPALAAIYLKGYIDENGAWQPGLAWSFPPLAGDDHEVVAAWDYRPSQAEVDADTDWEPDAAASRRDHTA